MKIVSWEQFTRSKVAIVVVFFIAVVSVTLYSYHQPWAHTRHVEHRTLLPAHYTLTSLETDDWVYDPLGTYIEKKFRMDTLVQRVASREIYDKLFPEEQEHIVFTGKQHYVALMTIDKSILWVYEDLYPAVSSPTTFSVVDDALISHLVIWPDPINIGCVVLLVIMFVGVYKILVDLWWQLRPGSVQT